MIYVIKRDGIKEPFNTEKIKQAVLKAFNAVEGQINDYAEAKAENIANYIEGYCEEEEEPLSIEEIQDLVENGLMSLKKKDVAKAYIKYREERNMARKNTVEQTIQEIVQCKNEYWNQENSNKNPQLATTQRDYIAGAVSTDLSKRRLLPKDIVDAHEKGILHFHDMDYYIQSIHNCDLINLEDMLQNGTVISEVKIDKPHKFSTACNIATQIIAQVASSQYGGQSISLAHLAPFVEETRKKFHIDYPELSEDTIEKMVNADITAGVQTLQYQIVTLMTTNGQAPFITVYMYINEIEDEQGRSDLAKVIEEVLKQRIQGVKNKQGIYITPAFPKLIYTLTENNIYKDSQYYYLTELAAKCSAKRLVPDYISEKQMLKLKGDVYTCMGCRSFLTPDRFTDAGIGNIANAKNYVEGKHKYYGRFNQGVVTINLVDIACSSNKDYNKFWQLFEERTELCHKALQYRHKSLLNTKSDIAPILWQNGALARLEKGETINKLLFNGYSTISLGYAGLYECTKYMTGESHTSEIGKPFALQIMKALNDKCQQWKKEENIDYSVYGTPIESVTYKFAKSLQERFGKIKDVTDHDYITNSYHVNVREQIDAFTKLKFEAEFQALSPGGAISYVEVPNMQNNIPAVLTLLEFMYNNIIYAELNTKSDYCQKCGYDGEIIIKGKTGNLYWECPNCGNTDQNTLNVARRTCGYIGSNFWNQGRTEEIKDRVLHLD